MLHHVAAVVGPRMGALLLLLAGLLAVEPHVKRDAASAVVRLVPPAWMPVVASSWLLPVVATRAAGPSSCPPCPPCPPFVFVTSEEDEPRALPGPVVQFLIPEPKTDTTGDDADARDDGGVDGNHQDRLRLVAIALCGALFAFTVATTVSGGWRDEEREEEEEDGRGDDDAPDTDDASDGAGAATAEEDEEEDAAPLLLPAELVSACAAHERFVAAAARALGTDPSRTLLATGIVTTCTTAAAEMLVAPGPVSAFFPFVVRVDGPAAAVADDDGAAADATGLVAGV